MKVDEICIKTLITINKAASAIIAAKLMLKHSIGSLIVVSDNQPIGIVTRGDLISHTANKKNENLDLMKIEDIMSRNLIKIEENIEVLEAANLMARYNIKHILVIKSNLPQKISRIVSLNLFAKKPENPIQITPPMVGIISVSDILKRLEAICIY